jgi:hypothetical protein
MSEELSGLIRSFETTRDLLQQELDVLNDVIQQAQRVLEEIPSGSTLASYSGYEGNISVDTLAWTLKQSMQERAVDRNELLKSLQGYFQLLSKFLECEAYLPGTRLYTVKGLQLRALIALWDQGIYTVEELIQVPWSELKTIPKYGVKSQRHFRNRLVENGIQIPDDWELPN